MKTIAFFNNKGGVGKTSLVYHLAWMLRERGQSVLAADLDPQSNLTSMFLDDPTVETLWPDGDHPQTVLGAVQPLMDRLGDIATPQPVEIAPRLSLIAGDLGLAAFEDRLASAWTGCLDDNPPNAGDAFRVMSAFYRLLSTAAAQRSSDIVLIDVGPNIGAMNRAALVAADYVVIPLGADLFSLQGLRNLGPTLHQWRRGWQVRSAGKVPAGLLMPRGSMQPLGYVLMNPSTRQNRPVKAYMRWADRVPAEYARSVLGLPAPAATAEADSNQLAMLKHFKSLMPLAQDARKPMFQLTAADGAIGGHAAAVADCRDQFERLAARLLSAVGLDADPAGH